MAKVTKKTVLTTVDGTPKKRLFLSIISDYDLRTGLCELIDNAFDFWVSNGKKPGLKISVVLDSDRQFIQVRDNAGGVSEDEAVLLIAPGATRNDMGHALIGIFGVGGKRAGVALGELVEIRTRRNNGKSIQIDLTNEWIESPAWDLDIYEIPDIDPGTTIVDITKVRQGFDKEDVERIHRHLGETYSWFIGQGCVVELNKKPISAITFDIWAYPPESRPRQAEFVIEPTQDAFLNVKLSGGLILDRDPERENYGIYIYCNHRLIVMELKARDVGYFVSAEAGVPHPDASLCRVLIEFYGPAELMPWNSSKSGINFSHPAFTQIRRRIIDFTSYYTGLSRRLKHQWDSAVFAHTAGEVEIVDPADALSNRRKIFPKLPSTKNPSHIELLKVNNRILLNNEPWTLGLIEAMGLVDLIGRQKYETRNRVALILLDSNFEIALKEFIVHRKDLFPSHTYTNTKLASLFSQRTNVIKEVQAHAKFPKTWGMPSQMRNETLVASAWSADGERVLAGVFHVIETKEFICVAFARDNAGRYRPYQRSHFLPSARAGEFALRRDLGRSFLDATPAFETLQGQPPGIDLFATIPDISRHHDAYFMLRDGFNQGSARSLLQEITRWIPDLDGNLVRDFQTSGYSARVWELYLWTALRALNFDIDYAHAVPDFCLSKRGEKIFVEATTVNSQDTFKSAMAAGPPPDAPDQLWPFLEHEMPQKFGSPLFSKMKKRYWEKPHVTGHPVILAIADFHAPASMRWSHTALPFYLYGVRIETTVDADNQLIERFVEGANHVVGEKIVPSNFFRQPDTEHIAGVLFSNAGTIVKFSRMGMRAGYGDPWVSLVRSGVRIDPSSDGFSAVPFKLDIENPNYHEDWWGELILFHNPHALHPIDEALFPGITHAHFTGGECIVRGPPQRVLHSTTTSYDFKRRKDGRPAWTEETAEPGDCDP